MELTIKKESNKIDSKYRKKDVEDPLDDLINFFNQILEDYDIDELIGSKNNLKN